MIHKETQRGHRTRQEKPLNLTQMNNRRVRHDIRDSFPRYVPPVGGPTSCVTHELVTLRGRRESGPGRVEKQANIGGLMYTGSEG